MAPFIAGIGFLLFSLYMMAHSIASFKKANLSQGWPEVEGKVIRSEAVRFQSTSKHRTLFVEYEYFVGQQKYVGTQDAFYTLSGEEVLELARQHQENPRVKVYYDPACPEESTLTKGVAKEKPYSDIILSGVGIAIGVGLIIFGCL